MATVIYALVITVLAWAAPVAAQTTRVGAIEEEQSEKSRRLAKEGPSEAEQIIRRILLSPLLSGGDGAYPWFGSVFGGSGMGLGAGFLKRLEHGSYFNAQAGISINGSTLLRGEIASPHMWRGRLQAEASGQWLEANDVGFYGLGQDSSQLTRQGIEYSPKDVAGNVTFKPVRFVVMTGGYSFLNFHTSSDTTLFSAGDAPGLDEELSYHVTRASIAFDWRSAPGYTTRGGLYRASFERNHEAQDRPFSFTSQEYEITHQLPLVREQFVLAVRGLMTLSNTDANQQVPVMLSPYLGSGSTLRGFANRRFTDRNRALLSGEYRWRPSRYLDMALFLDAGQVAPNRRDFDIDEFDVAWGIGARFHGPSFTAFRIDVARGREGIRLVFAGSQPF
jgi:hypothetical protein